MPVCQQTQGRAHVFGTPVEIFMRPTRNGEIQDAVHSNVWSAQVRGPQAVNYR